MYIIHLFISCRTVREKGVAYLSRHLHPDDNDNESRWNDDKRTIKWIDMEVWTAPRGWKVRWLVGPSLGNAFVEIALLLSEMFTSKDGYRCAENSWSPVTAAAAATVSAATATNDLGRKLRKRFRTETRLAKISSDLLKAALVTWYGLKRLQIGTGSGD